VHMQMLRSGQSVSSDQLQQLMAQQFMQILHAAEQQLTLELGLTKDQLRAGMNQSLDWSKAYTDERFDSFDRNLRRTDDRASAGVAAAMAVAGLPQPYEAGRSMAAVAAGSYNGESGVAVGISGVSEGGRWIYKVAGTTNSRGEGGVSVGAGIQW
ncbi:MAG: YadA family autotransporter adhesin, partial [Stenotrophomonas sp.]